MIERCFDYRQIKHLLNDYPVISDEIIYLVKDNHLLYFMPSDDDSLVLSTSYYNPCIGKTFKSFAKGAFDWCFEETNAKIIRAKIHVNNKQAQVMAHLIGMKRTHVEDYHIYYEIKKC